MADTRPTLPPGGDHDESGEDFITSLTNEIQDPLQRARENLIDVDSVEVEKRRRFSRRRHQEVADSTGGASEGRLVDPFAVLTASLDSEEEAAQAAEWESLGAVDEPTSFDPSHRADSPYEDASAGSLLRPHATIDSPTTSNSSAAIRGTFPRRSKSQAESPAESAPRESGSTPLEKAKRAHRKAEASASAAQRQFEDAREAAKEATSRAAAAERQALETQRAADEARAEADANAKRIATLEEELTLADGVIATQKAANDDARQTLDEVRAEAAAARSEADAKAERVANLEEQLAFADGIIATEQLASSEARRERDEAQAALARHAGELAALTRSEAEARSRAETLAVESGAASARARSEARHRAIAEEAARTQAEALRAAQAQLLEAQEALTLAEQSHEAARQLAMHAADQIVAAAAERVQAEKAKRLQAEARADAAEEKLRGVNAAIAAQAASHADALVQASLSQKATRAAAKRRTAEDAARALADFQSGAAELSADGITDDWAFEELQATDWAPAPPAPRAAKGDGPQEEADTMDPSDSGRRRGRFNRRRGKVAEEPYEADGGPTPIENLAGYVAAQGLDVPDDLLPHPEVADSVENDEVESNEVASVEAADENPRDDVVAPAEDPAADDLWAEPDADDDSDDAADVPAPHARRGLLRRRSTNKQTSNKKPDTGLVDDEPELTGTMEAADEPSTEASVETTDQPAPEERVMSEEPTTIEQSDDHVWTAAELAAEGWTTEDLRGAGWTDAHLESIGWKLDDAASEETAAEDSADEAADEATSEPDEPTLFGDDDAADEDEDSSDEPAEETAADTADQTDEATDETSEQADEPEAATDVEDESTDESTDDSSDADADDDSTEETVTEAEPEAVVAAAEPEVVAEPEPEVEVAAAAEPEPVKAEEAAPATSIPAATALTLQDLTPDEIERALMFGESLSDILARKNAALAAAAVPAATIPEAVTPATASTAVEPTAAGSEPSPETTTSGSGGGDRGGDDADDPDPAAALAEPDLFADFDAPHEPEVYVEPATSVIPAVVDVDDVKDEQPGAIASTTATRAASGMIASEAATETGASDAERIEYRPSNSRRYVFGGAFIGAAVLSVVAIFWAIQNPGITQSITAGCLVVLTGALWWSLMAWSPRIISIGHGVLEFAQGGHVERFNLLDPDSNIAVGADPTSRTWRTEVVRTNGTKIVVRADDVRPQQFSALVAKYREEADAAR